MGLVVRGEEQCQSACGHGEGEPCLFFFRCCFC
jgi:hypothetical protein